MASLGMALRRPAGALPAAHSLLRAFVCSVEWAGRGGGLGAGIALMRQRERARR